MNGKAIAGEIESYLFSHAAGSTVLDAIVQANIDLESMTMDELRGLLDRFAAPVRCCGQAFGNSFNGKPKAPASGSPLRRLRLAVKQGSCF